MLEIIVPDVLLYSMNEIQAIFADLNKLQDRLQEINEERQRVHEIIWNRKENIEKGLNEDLEATCELIEKDSFAVEALEVQGARVEAEIEEVKEELATHQGTLFRNFERILGSVGLLDMHTAKSVKIVQEGRKDEDQEHEDRTHEEGQRDGFVIHTQELSQELKELARCLRIHKENLSVHNRSYDDELQASLENVSESGRLAEKEEFDMYYQMTNGGLVADLEYAQEQYDELVQDIRDQGLDPQELLELDSSVEKATVAHTQGKGPRPDSKRHPVRAKLWDEEVESWIYKKHVIGAWINDTWTLAPPENEPSLQVRPDTEYIDPVAGLLFTEASIKRLPHLPVLPRNLCHVEESSYS